MKNVQYSRYYREHFGHCELGYMGQIPRSTAERISSFKIKQANLLHTMTLYAAIALAINQ